MEKMRNPAVTHKIMTAIHSKGTKPELMLRKALWRKNLRYRVNYPKLPGKPDIVFTKYKVAVFCDGDFWHGHNWVIRGKNSLEEELAGYSQYWQEKILRNIERDKEDDERLRDMGWTVIRIWESDIKKNVDECVQLVQETLFEAIVSNYDDLLYSSDP